MLSVPDRNRQKRHSLSRPQINFKIYFQYDHQTPPFILFGTELPVIPDDILIIIKL
jgi:hypothetical protein